MNIGSGRVRDLLNRYPKTDIRWDVYNSASIWRGRATFFVGGILQVVVIIAIGFVAFKVGARYLAQLILPGMGALVGYLNVNTSRIATQFYMGRKSRFALDDERSPILYLRSFFADKEYLLVEASRDDPESGPILHRWKKWSIEAEFCRRLAAYGPVFAIGRPGDRLPKSGAIRLYVSDFAWQSVVQDLMEVASIIAIRLDRSDSLRWETEKLIELGHLKKALFFTLDSYGRPLDASMYKRLRSWLPNDLSLIFPDTIRNNWGVYFDNWRFPCTIDAGVAMNKTEYCRAVDKIIQNFIQLGRLPRVPNYNVDNADLEVLFLRWGLPLISAVLVLIYLAG